MRERIRRNVGLGMAVILLVSSLGCRRRPRGRCGRESPWRRRRWPSSPGLWSTTGVSRSQRFRFIWTVCLCGRGVDYRLSYADNLDAGTAVVMATGTGAYHGSREAKFTILPRTISAQALQIEAGCQKEYDETTEAFPTVSVQVLPGTRWRCAVQRPMTPVSWAGKKRSRCLDCTLVARMGDNYRLETSDLVLKTTDKSPPTAGLPKVCCIGQGAFLDLRTLFSGRLEGGGTVSADRRGPGLYPCRGQPSQRADTWDCQAAGDDDWLG